METIGLVISCILSLAMALYLLRVKKKTQLQTVFIINSILVFGWCALLLAQKYFCANFEIYPIVFEWFIYIFACLLPVSILFTGIIFANTKIEFKKKYILIFIIPILSLIMLWTNNLHHLFYVNYSTNIGDTIFGIYFNYVHSPYGLMLYAIGLVYLIVYSIKNSGIFSKQAMLLIIGAAIPIIVNFLGVFHIASISIYLTPICFTITILLSAFAILKFDFLKVTPIALQRIVDRISDGYVVVNEDHIITDFNETFLTMFSLKPSDIRNVSIFEWNKYLPNLENIFQSISISPKTIVFEADIKELGKHFNVEVSSIVNKNVFLGILLLFKDVTQHIEDLEIIKSNQDMLIERERFASLGQMIGGIAHNLKTPIMSISGAAEALDDLISEYDTSIGDPEVTNEDHHEIAEDMRSWVAKVRTHTAYMSEIITAVKGQAISSNESTEKFTIDELLSRVSILMKHDLKHSLVDLNFELSVDKEFSLYGNINALVQVIDNLISNAIQSYDGKPDSVIDFIVEKQNNNIVFSIRDYGCGMSHEVQEKLFKEMVTTKGKNGTGLGLFMSYSNIKAKFNGNITFTSKLRRRHNFFNYITSRIIFITIKHSSKIIFYTKPIERINPFYGLSISMKAFCRYNIM